MFPYQRGSTKIGHRLSAGRPDVAQRVGSECFRVPGLGRRATEIMREVAVQSVEEDRGVLLPDQDQPPGLQEGLRDVGAPARELVEQGCEMDREIVADLGLRRD